MSKETRVTRRNDAFVDKTETRIWSETPSDSNPYLSQQNLCHGYDIIELASKRSFTDVLYLLFRGELPDKNESRLLQTLLILFINPGPRHAATRASMTAAVSKADPGHLLPISLSLLGAADVGESIRFLRGAKRKPATDLAAELIAEMEPESDGDLIISPGFGSCYGSIDEISLKYAETLLECPGKHDTLEWGMEFAATLNKSNMGWLTTGVVAAALSDLGFRPNAGVGLYQTLSAPGLLAHGLELANKPLTAMPFISDDNYVFET